MTEGVLRYNGLLMECYGIGELKFYIHRTDDSIQKAIQTLLKLENKIGGSTGEFAAYRKTLKEIRADLAVVQKSAE
ncbi:hypothetical protein TELCIR_02195 [Teladorsagia circumcincta]|uniref:Uncharacterized protein n=1 Tax=Teladorsagia circumcincta TaxID=45464 RepID=A0A2G9UZT6_TELCI|nr:hypothetical protein TELCIR_02195 [Teladorsagia circumcincta]